MGVRGAGHRFMPNRLVFPGGAVDRVDRTSPAATEPNPDLLAALARNARPPLARAIAMAAARELQEETGLTLGVPARLDGLDYLCRAVTPPESPVRFNARFLIASAERLEGSVADTHELQDVGFRPLSTLDRSVLVLVTREVLDRLDTWLSPLRGSTVGPPRARRVSPQKMAHRVVFSNRRRWTGDRRTARR